MKRNLVKIVSVLLCVCALLALSGCNKAETPGDAIAYFTELMNENDFRGAFEYVDSYDNFSFSKGSEDIIGAVAASMRIDIIEESSTDTSATFTVDITTVDLRKAYVEAAEQVIPEYYAAAVSGGTIDEGEVGERMVDKVVEISGSSGAPMVTTRCSLKLITDDAGRWYIKLDTTSYNAITGFLDEANNLITTGSITNEISGYVSEPDDDTPVTDPVSDSDTQ